MATGRVQSRFLYARTRPASPLPKPELAPFNKRVFFLNPKPGPSSLAQPCHLRPNQWPNKKKIYFVWIFKPCRTA